MVLVVLGLGVKGLGFIPYGKPWIHTTHGIRMARVLGP